MTTQVPHPYYAAFVIPRDFQSGPNMEAWMNRDRARLDAILAEAQAKWNAGALAQPYDGNRQRWLQGIITSTQAAIASIDSRAALTWNDAFEYFKGVHLPAMQRWVETYVEQDGKLYSLHWHPLLVLSRYTARELAQEYWMPFPRLSNIDYDASVATGAIVMRQTEEFTILAEGRGFQPNVLLPEVSRAIADATGDRALVQAGLDGTKNDHWKWATRTVEGRALGRVYCLVVNGGGWFGGWGAISPTHPDWPTHPEFGNEGLALCGAEVTFRQIVTGIADPTDILRGYAWISGLPRPASESHEMLGHGSSVLCHPGDQCLQPGAWSTIAQTVRDLNVSPCQGNWWGAGQVDAMIRAGTYHLYEIPYRPPLAATFDGVDVTVDVRWDPPPEGLQLRFNGIPGTHYTPLSSGTVKIEAYGGIGVHYDQFAELLATLYFDVEVAEPPPPPPPPPQPRILERIWFEFGGSNPVSLVLARGERYPFRVIGQFNDGTTEALGATVTSSQPKRVRVDNDALLGVKATPGNSSVTVTAVYGAKSAGVNVRVV